MIDTLRLRTTIKHLNELQFTKIASEKSGKLKFKIFKDQINVGSFSYFINIFINNYNEIFIEFSLPKLLNGNNINESTFKDIKDSLLLIKDSLSNYMDIEDPQNWEVMRIDLCHYIKSENPYNDIFLYQTLNYPRKKKYIYDTSVMFVGNSFSTKLYIKYDEYFKHDFKKIVKYDQNLAYTILELSKNKIRLETSYRHKALKNILKLKKITISDIIRYKHLLIKHFRETQRKLYSDIDPNKMKQKTLLEELQKYYKPQRALQLYQFWVFYTSDDLNKKLLKMYYSRSQIYRNLKAISNILKLN